MEITIQDKATPHLRELMLRVSGRRAYAVVGQAVRVLVREHLREKEAQPNKRGWPKQHFYARARERTTFEATEDSATVSVALEGFRFRYTGGTIRPVNKKALTIPMAPEAYGKAAGEFDLRFQPSFRGRVVGLLVGTGNLEGKVMYLLVNQVRQNPDPTVIPTDAEIVGSAIDALTRVVDQL